MKYLSILKKIFKKKETWVSFFLIFFILFWILRALPHFELLWQFWNLEGITFSRFFEVFWEKTILTIPLSTWGHNVIAFLLPAMIALNIILFKEFYNKQKIFLQSKTFFASLGGMFLGLFGVGCVACSGLIVAPLISLLGLGSFFNVLPYGGAELGYVGLLFIIISNIYLIKKISDPLICK